jgi:CubicO group peptidase (beta-lactamase class C family)
MVMSKAFTLRRTFGRAGRAVLVALVALVATSSCTTHTTVVSETVSARDLRIEYVWPGAQWDSITTPAARGWSRDGLERVRAKLATLPSTGFVAIVGGRVLMSYGDLQAVSYLASVRKSVLAMLMGNYVAQGKVHLDKTLAELGIDDIGGLSDQEKQATVRDLLSARSGVYHAASNSGDDLANAPPRGSQQHGTYYLYNNWDFNAIGAIFEQETGRNIYDALETDLARPIRMQDFDRANQRKSGDTTQSRYLAYHMYLSTRDMARIGYLMLRHGNWAGRQLVPADWVDQIKSPVTRVTEMNPPGRRSGPFGYGYLWWVWDGPRATGPYEGAFTGLGAVGQHITILPKLDLVVAHKTRPGGTASVSHPQFLEVLDLLVQAHCGTSCPR